MTVFLSWVIATMGIACLILLGWGSYQKYQRTQAEADLETCQTELGKSVKNGNELAVQLSECGTEFSVTASRLKTALADAEYWGKICRANGWQFGPGGGTLPDVK